MALCHQEFSSGDDLAKRFTDTGKWKRSWFRALGLHAKVLWQFAIDDCDHAGVWIVDFELTTFQVGFKVDEEKLREWLGDKLVKIAPDRYFIPSFYEFQYRDAKDSFKAKQYAIKELRAWNLIDESDSLIDLTNSYLSVTKQSPDCHIKIKSKIKINTGDARGDEKVPADAYESVYQKYPKKIGKSDGLKKLKKLIRTKEALATFEKAMLAYVADCQKNDVFLKQFDSFVNSPWVDWLDPSAGGAVSNSKTPDLSDIFNKDKPS